MKLFQHIIARLFILTALFALLTLASAPALAQLPPSIRVDPVWRPPTQLTTIDTGTLGQTDALGDDLRYATVDIYATTTVQFWAVGFTCYVNKLALERYGPPDPPDPGSTEDDVPMFTVGVDWRAYALKTPDTTTFDADGKLNFAIAVAGDYSPPLGSNGVSKTLHLASLKFRVKEGLTLPTLSAFTCTTQFLNRDGRVVLYAAFYPPPYLSIVPGYTLSGVANYQGLATIYPTSLAQAIGVQCDDDGNATYDDIVTTANIYTGVFTAANLRKQGRYDCRFIGNIKTAGPGPDLHLMAVTDFNLTTASYALLPVTLKSGNVNTASTPTSVEASDVNYITANWGLPLTTLTAPYMLGDASGDRMINEVDLALVAGNYYSFEPIRAQHLIYSLPRDYLAFQNSHLWLGNLGNYGNASVTQFVPGNTRDYWPALSPDGSKIAFTRNVGVGGNDRFVLYAAAITNGVVGPAVPLTPLTAPYDAFAPSWSPTGERLAFVCSYNDEWFSAANPHGNLCLIDSRGLNFQQVQGYFQLSNTRHPVTVKIYPPAWVGSEFIYFGYSAISGTPEYCDNKICSIRLSDNVVAWSSALPAGADMPAVREGVLGLTLFYQIDTGGNTSAIRYAQLDSLYAIPNGYYPNSIPGSLHNDVVLNGIPTPYYAVSTGADPDLFFYTRDPAVAGDGGGSLFFLVFFNGPPAAPSWSWNTYRVSDGVGNLALTSEYYAALRNTVAFVP